MVKQNKELEFINPDIESSYQQSAMGEILYNAVLESNAKRIIDFGILNGYSTVCMAMAAKQTGGTVYAYDLFGNYKYTNSNIKNVVENLKKYEVSNIVILQQKDFNVWIQGTEKFDLLHVDVSNTGNVIENLYNSLKTRNPKDFRVFFEGGSADRDEQDWMKEYNKRKINPLLTHVPFTVLKQSQYKINGRTFFPCISELDVK